MTPKILLLSLIITLIIALGADVIPDIYREDPVLDAVVVAG